MLRVLHVTEDHSTRNTGISTAVDALTRCLPAAIQPGIVCVGEETLALREGIHLLALPTGGMASAWRYSRGGEKKLAEAVADSDIIHLHGLWMWVQWSAARLAVRMKKPLIVTPHGMLEPWIWQRQSSLQRLKKVIYWNGVAYPAFRHANMIHAITSREGKTLAQYFPGQSRIEIPHGIDLQAAGPTSANQEKRDPNKPPYFLFVGRLHPVKAIHLLIRAFARLPETSFALKIAGPDQPQEQAYADSLHRLVAELGLSGRVVFLGPVQGSTKWQLYRQAWAFCLPSFSEVIGMVNLEAAAVETPVITSYESGVVDDWERCGGLRVHPDEESILAGLRQAVNWSEPARLERGKALRSLIERVYSWSQVGQKWAELYQSMMTGFNHA